MQGLRFHAVEGGRKAARELFDEADRLLTDGEGLQRIY